MVKDLIKKTRKMRNNRSVARSFRLETNSLLGNTLTRLRKITGLRQVEIGRLLNLDQAGISRIESGFQSLTPQDLTTLAEHFGITLDGFFSGKINYWKVAEKFGRKLPLPMRYLEKPYSRVREILPLLLFLNETQGDGFVAEYLAEFDLDSFLFSNPDQQIGVNCLLDLLRESISRNYINASNFQKLIRATQSESVHGFLHHVYESQDSAFSLIRAWVLNAHHYDDNFKYIVEEETKDSLLLSITPHVHMKDVEYKDDGLRDFLCRYKKDYLSSFPNYVKLAPLTLKEHECHFTSGAKRCLYRLKTA